jgi:hypothetical protein
MSVSAAHVGNKATSCVPATSVHVRFPLTRWSGLKALLEMDNTPGHPQGLEEDLNAECGFIQVTFLPPNTTLLIQPMDQQVISNFKKLYIKAPFQRCFEVTLEPELTLTDFWKDHFNILHCLRITDKA